MFVLFLFVCFVFVFLNLVLFRYPGINHIYIYIYIFVLVNYFMTLMKLSVIKWQMSSSSRFKFCNVNLFIFYSITWSLR